MITLPLVQPTIMIQFFIIFGSLFHQNPPLNMNFPIILIILMFYNIIFYLSHLHMIDYRVYRPHKNKITNKQITKRHVCSNAQRRMHVFRAIVWRDDRIFKVNIYNSRNGCAFIISSPIVRGPKAFQQNKTLLWDRFW